MSSRMLTKTKRMNPCLVDEPEPDDEPAPVQTIAADTPAGTAVQAVQRILTAVGADVDVTLRSGHDELAGGPVIDINGPDSGLLIGRRGNTLHSLQFIVQSIVRQQYDEEVRVSLDVEQYRQRREDSLREMADRVADRVVADWPQHHAGADGPFRPPGNPPLSGRARGHSHRKCGVRRCPQGSDHSRARLSLTRARCRRFGCYCRRRFR